MTTTDFDRIATEAAERMTETIRKAVEQYASAYAAAGDLETRLTAVIAEARAAGWSYPYATGFDVEDINYGKWLGLFSDGTVREVSYHARKSNWYIRFDGALLKLSEVLPGVNVLLVKQQPEPISTDDDEGSD